MHNTTIHNRSRCVTRWDSGLSFTALPSGVSVAAGRPSTSPDPPGGLMRTKAALTAVLVAGLAVVAPTTASAATVIHGTLTGSAVVPGPGDTNGKGTLQLKVNGDTLCYKLKV